MAFETIKTGPWSSEPFLSLWTPPLPAMTDVRMEPTYEMQNCKHLEMTCPKSFSNCEPDTQPKCANFNTISGISESNNLHSWLESNPSFSYSDERQAGIAQSQSTNSPRGVLHNNRNTLSMEDSSRAEMSRVLINFLPAEERASDGGAKFGRVAEIMRLEDGTLKLFAERGRLIETRITFEPADKDRNESLRLRFTPFSSRVGVHEPVIGYHNRVQKMPYMSTDQLCFVQLGAVEHQKPNDCRYETDCRGYLSMDIPLAGNCSIYPLVFPYHNSQCPTSCRKAVYIRVSVMRPDGHSICSTHFQVVSCASPMRDFKRVQERQLNVRQQKTRKIIEDLQCKDEQTAKSAELLEIKRKANQSRIDLDISPGSSGFASSGSPTTYLGVIEEDYRYAPTLSTKHAPTENNLGYTNTRVYRPEQGHRANYTLVENGLSNVCSPSDVTHQAMGTSRKYFSQISTEKQNDPRGLDKCDQVHTDVSAEYQLDQAHGGTDGEYIIRTKSWRIYRILQTLEKELSAVYGEDRIDFKRFRSDST